jgi:hypothetical protein
MNSVPLVMRVRTDTKKAFQRMASKRGQNLSQCVRQYLDYMAELPENDAGKAMRQIDAARREVAKAAELLAAEKTLLADVREKYVQARSERAAVATRLGMPVSVPPELRS